MHLAVPVLALAQPRSPNYLPTSMSSSNSLELAAEHPHYLRAFVRSTQSKEHSGIVTAAKDDVATVDFQPKFAPFVPIARELSVAFRSSESFQPFVARSRVIEREDSDDHLRYKLRFNERDAQTIRAMFTRRASPRVVPAQMVRVAVRDAEQADSTNQRATLCDISTSGFAVYVDAVTEMQLCSVRRVRVFFQIPGSAEVIDLIGDLRHRRLVEKSVQLAVAIDWKVTKNASRARKSLQEYVRLRKREILGCALGPDDIQWKD
jgi:hypothetical protein